MMYRNINLFILNDKNHKQYLSVFLDENQSSGSTGLSILNSFLNNRFFEDKSDEERYSAFIDLVKTSREVEVNILNTETPTSLISPVMEFNVITPREDRLLSSGDPFTKFSEVFGDHTAIVAPEYHCFLRDTLRAEMAYCPIRSIIIFSQQDDDIHNDRVEIYASSNRKRFMDPNRKPQKFIIEDKDFPIRYARVLEENAFDITHYCKFDPAIFGIECKKFDLMS